MHPEIIQSADSCEGAKIVRELVTRKIKVYRAIKKSSHKGYRRRLTPTHKLAKMFKAAPIFMSQ
jgi:hypothetical protein